MTTVLSVVHLLGFALGLGAATTKTLLLLRCRSDRDFIPAYLSAHRLITRVILAGLLLLVLSGIGFFFAGMPLTGRLIAKLVMVVAIFVLGPLIDNVAEPRFKKFAPAAASAPSPEFARAERLYVSLELTATLLFYFIAAFWLFQ